MRNGGNIEVGGYNSGNDKGIILTPADSSSYWHIYNDAGGELVFGRNITIGSSEHMRIDQAGLVGIGQNNPQETLDVRGGDCVLKLDSTTNGSGVSWVKFADQGTVKWGIGLSKNSGNSSSDFTFYEDASSGNPALTIKDGGNVGIGTTTPGQTLSVDASGGANLFVSRTGQTGGLYIESDGTNGVIRNPANNPIIFQTNGANDRMQVTSTGLKTSGGLYEVHSSNPNNFVAGCAADTWHDLTNYNYQNTHNGPGVDHTAQTITQVIWQNNSASLGYIVRMYVIHGAYSANTHTIYSSAGTDSVLDAGSSFAHIYPSKYDTGDNGGLVYATLHTTSTTLKIGVRFNNHTGTAYNPLTMQIKTNAPPASGTTPIMRVWRI